MYCWFDWDDNTTSVQSLSIIKEPRKDWNEYVAGDEVTAKLPKYGMWRGVIVEIGESKKDLETKMKMRQKTQAEMLNEGTSTGIVQKESSEAEKDVLVERKKKKALEKAKLAASNKEVENMLLDRRATAQKSPSLQVPTPLKAPSTQEPPAVEDHPSAQKHADINSLKHNSKELIPSSDDGESFQNLASAQQSSTSSSNYPDLYWSSQNFPYMYSGVQYQQNYSYLNDINSPPSPYTNTTLSSRSEMEERIRGLMEENQRLKEENQSLRSQLGKHQISPDICATPSKIRFLKRLTSELENKPDTTSTSFTNFTSTQITVESTSSVHHQSTDETSSVYNQSTDETLSSGTLPVPTTVLRPKPLRFQALTPRSVDSGSDLEEDTRPVWEETVTNSGIKKVKLVADHDVWILPSQLSMANHKAGGNPRKLLVNLLDVFFSGETLASSSAKGSRQAHNKKDTDKASKALNSTVLDAIKAYVLNAFKKASGEACLSDSTINDVINNKCATARRALKS